MSQVLTYIGGQHLEQVERNYFDELHLKSFFEKNKRWPFSFHVFDSSVHRLAEFIAGLEFTRIDSGNPRLAETENVRHLSNEATSRVTLSNM